MTASEFPDAERLGAVTRKFDARSRKGAAAASASGWRGSMLWMESGSRTTDPVTGPPVSGPYLKTLVMVVGASGSSASITSTQAL